MRNALIATSVILMATVGCSSGGGSSQSAASTAAPASTATSTTTTGTMTATGAGPVTTRPVSTAPVPATPTFGTVTTVTSKPAAPITLPTTTVPTTPVSRGSTGVSTGISTTGSLQISLSPSAAAAGSVVAILFSGLKSNAASVVMGLMDSTGNWVKDQYGNPLQISQQGNPNDPSELDFQVPQVAINSYSCVVEELDSSSNLLDDAVAAFSVTSTTTTTGVVPNSPTGATTTGASTTGSLRISATPGAGAPGTWVTVNLTGFDSSTIAYAYVQLVSAGNTPIQVQQTIDQQLSNFPTSLAIDFQIPQAAAGTYVVDVEALGSSEQLLDDAQASFLINGTTATSSTPTTYPAINGVSNKGGLLAFTCNPGGGAPGAVIAVTLTNMDNTQDQLAFGFYDASGNSITTQAQQNASNAAEIDFVIPQTPNGTYQVLIEEQSGGAAVDDSIATFVVNSAAAGTTAPTTAGSATGVSSYGGQLNFTVAPSGGAPGTAVAIVVNAINSAGDGLGAGLFDSNNNFVAGTTFSQNPNNPAEIDFVIPAAANGVYTLLVEEQNTSGQAVDDAVAPFTIGTTPGTTIASGVGTTVLGSLTIASVNPTSVNVGQTVAVVIGGLTSGNVGIGLRDPANPSAAIIAVQQMAINQATSTATSTEIDIVIPSAVAGNYQLVVEDFGASAVAGSQPIGAATAPITLLN